MRREFNLPDPGEGLTDADIVQWLVAPGDTISVNQPIVEIETAKSLVELPSPFDGVVAELLIEVGANVAVGEPILVVETTSPDDAQAEPEADEESGAVLVGYGVTASEPSRRRVRRVKPDAGTSNAGGPGGTELSRRGHGAESQSTPRAAGSRSAAVGAGEPGQGSGTSARGGPAAPAAEGAVGRDVLAKPPVRKLARDLGIDLTAVRGTGPGGIITRDDVVEYADNAANPVEIVDADGDPWLVGGKVTEDGRQTRVPVKSVRRRTAEAMVASAFTAPHVTVFHTVDVTRSIELLAKMKEDREFAGIRLTPLLLTMKALLIAVARHPEVNASWDAENEEIVYKHYVNLGIAASTPRGLMVPNIKDAHRLSLKELASELAGLTERARAGATPPAEMSDGTITITNVGVFGIDTGTPILNPGEAAILAFGAIRQMPWVVDGEIVPRHVTQLSLSFDHRLVDGELGSRVLADVARILEDPGQALIWG
ncbi:pyruvate dehydrogenase E2 component (dihydrolipoamide acetyltransferase) [Ruaniaceae bacterium KH17]|nr:pyruvate dehydrogenase E2 component (dihydrolipoamide acetyltransferase) [Ruaniaceae bacterium KH17]